MVSDLSVEVINALSVVNRLCYECVELKQVRSKSENGCIILSVNVMVKAEYTIHLRIR